MGEIDASTFIKRAWRKIDGVYQWIDLNWQDNDFPEGYQNHIVEKLGFQYNGDDEITVFRGNEYLHHIYHLVLLSR